MKRFIAACCLLLLVAFSRGNSDYNGKPGCKTSAEIGKLWRNFWDPMSFWRCYAQGMEALSDRCIDGTAFLPSAGRCVPWSQWKWEVIKYPPSCPDGVVCMPSQLLPSLSYA